MASATSSFIRHELAAIAPDYHGATNIAELEQWGIDPQAVLDFSVNSNPYGPSAAVLAAMATIRPELYPDRDCWQLRRVLSDHLQLPVPQIMVGNGAAELLWLLAFACLQPQDSVLVIAPTFGEYARNARLMGATVTEWRASPEDDFAIHPNAIRAEIERVRPRLVHLCNPNNPTGQVVALEIIRAWATQFPDTLFLIDEAYYAFVEGLESALSLGLPNIVVVRSMTKEYALAGVRLGYVVGAPELIAALMRVRIPWSVNVMAQAAGVAALKDHAIHGEIWTRLATEAAHFRRDLTQLGYTLYPSHTHYFLMEVEHGAQFRTALLPHGLLVRLCDSFGLPHCVRIATRTASDNQKLLEVLRAL